MSKKFLGFLRKDGSVGIRNYVLIIPVQGILRMVAENICKFVPDTRTTFFPGELGRSKKDRMIMRRIFVGLGLNPNVFSVLVIGIKGAVFQELNNESIKEEIAKSGKMVETLILEEGEGIFNALEKGVKIAREMVFESSKARRELYDLRHLNLAVKCGYSDPTSGIVGNPVVGKVFDEIVNVGGKAFFSESSEIIGGEHILAKRAKNKEVIQKIFRASKDFEEKALSIGEDIRAINPMPANKAAGISTLEEKALGAIAKSGSSIIEDVTEYGVRPIKGGLYFMDASPTDDLFVGFAAAGAQLMLFQVGTSAISLNLHPSGRGGIVMPISYITGNTDTYEKNKDNIDFNSGMLLENMKSMGEVSENLLCKIIEIASGTKTKVETTNYQDRVELYLQDPTI
jgi:altronate dehydratase large subunit